MVTMNKRIIAIASLVMLGACVISGEQEGENKGKHGNGQDHAQQRVGSAALLLAQPQAPLSDAELMALAPTKTRAGHVRFTGAGIHDPNAAVVFLRRLQAGADSADVRAALVEALPRTGGQYAHALPQLLAGEADVGVRQAIVFAAKRAPAAWATEILSRGFADDAWQVRAEAARVAGARADGATYKAQLITLQGDSDAAARQAASQALQFVTR